MKNPLTRIRNYFARDILDRINDLETGMRVLVDSPAYRPDDRTGFNGQSGRKRIFLDLVGRFAFSRLVETGTYLGDTTGYMARTTGLPVHSCERNPSLFALARYRLKDVPRVSLSNMDSREFLLGLSARPEMVEGACFFYLDAHWGRDVPLNEEISIIASRWKEFIVMIDDFEVPGDDGYAHGSYGTLRRIGMAKLRTVYDLGVFFPTTPSSAERAGATGCVVLAKNGPYTDALGEISSIRRHVV
ncbi:MAG: hypothetical protein OEZ09_00385 [Betaproteobacteria bacterium]|nr:hypothetical protein [Betaproteobacteria bacterium]